jgi:hypothetical protein
MLKVAGREEDDWLRVKDIEEFPCTDLRMIDTLWVKYSKGRFGFSVQKRIWESVGGTPDADLRTYERFGDRVKWRVNSEWLDCDKLNFTSQAPKGHLPIDGVRLEISMFKSISLSMGFGDSRLGLGREDKGLGVSSLASRLVHCNI